MSISSEPEQDIINRPETIDPLVRASYSSNPRFIDGATEPHPIDTEEKSLLTRPEIAEALEVSYIVNADHPTNLVEIDLGLAKRGLQWLRKNLDENATQLKSEVVVAKSEVVAEERSRRLKADQARARRQVEEQEAERRKAATQAEATQKAERTAFEANQAAYRQEFAQAIETVTTEFPELKGDRLLRLSEHLEITDESGTVVRLKDSFRQTLSRQVNEYLEDPDILTDDIILLAHLRNDLSTSSPEAPLVTSGHYGNILVANIDEAVASSHYNLRDFSPPIINKWLNILIEAHYAKEKRSASPLIENPGSTRMNLMPAAKQGAINVGHTMDAYGGKIIENTLHNVLYNQPERFVDTMHMIAREGLDPEDKVVSNITIGILRHCLRSEPLATAILLAATATKDLKTQHKAIDLSETLMLLDSTCKDLLAIPHYPKRVSQLNNEELKIIRYIYNRYLKINNQALYRHEQKELDRQANDNIRRFLEEVAASESEATIYRRFNSYENDRTAA